MKEESQVYSISISHRDIIEKRVKPTARKLKSHKGTQNKPLHIVVEGYDKDERELYDIKEVRTFFKSLSKQYTDILNPTISLDSIYVIIRCLIPPPNTCSLESLHYYKASVVMKLAEKSRFGKDLASHVAISVFSKFEPSVGIGSLSIQPKTDEDRLLLSFIEGGMDLTRSIEVNNGIFIKIKNWDFDGKILASIYSIREKNYPTKEIVIPRYSNDLDEFLRSELIRLGFLSSDNF